MEVSCNLQLPGLEEALAALLPQGVQPLRLSLDAQAFALQAKAPMVGTVDLTADVRVLPDRLRLERFQVKGAGLLNGMIENQLRGKLSALDKRQGPLRLSGDSEGSSVDLSWGG